MKKSLVILGVAASIGIAWACKVRIDENQVKAEIVRGGCHTVIMNKWKEVSNVPHFQACVQASAAERNLPLLWSPSEGGPSLVLFQGKIVSAVSD